MIKHKSTNNASLNYKKKSVNSVKKNKRQRAERSKKSGGISFTAKLVLISVACVSVVTGMVMLAKSQMSISEKQKILDNLNTQISQQKAANDELEQKLNGDLDEYIEDYARDKLDMVKPGEHVYINTAGN